MTSRTTWLVVCATVTVAGALVGTAVAFHGPMTFRPLGVRVQMGDAIRPLALAAIADIALIALAFRRRPWRLCAFVLAVTIAVMAALAVARRAAPAYPVSDRALIELATINALDGQQLHGLYSRYGWRHPGPLLFYLLAPFYAAAGSQTAGLAAGALAINLAALIAALWVLNRNADPALTMAFTALFGWYLVRVSGLLVSSWNPHATVVAAAALVIAGAAVSAGQTRLLPLFLLLASFVLQTHIGTLPLVASSGALVAAAMGRRWIGASSEDRAALNAQANRAAWVLVALWLLPVVEELSRPDGNMTAMWRFARQGTQGGDVGQAFGAWAGALTGLFRSSLPLPRGQLLVHEVNAHPGTTAVPLLILLAGVVAWAARRGDGLHAWTAAHALAAGAAALWAVTRIPDGIHDHEVFWISAIGVVGAASILAVFGKIVAGSWPRIRTWSTALAGASAAALLVGVSIEGLHQLALAGRPRRPTVFDSPVLQATQAVQTVIQREGARRPMVLIDQRVWDAAAGVILQLRKQGVRVVVERGLVTMFAGTLSPDGGEDLEISFCGGPCHERQISRPGNIVVLLTDRIAIDARPLHR